jgi:hypothetical protein
MIVLPDECSVVTFSMRQGKGSKKPGRDCSLRTEFLNVPQNNYTHEVCGAEPPKKGGRSNSFRGPWLNVDQRIGYMILYPPEGRFNHGIFRKGDPKAPRREHQNRRETRSSFMFPGTETGKSCTLIVCDQGADETGALAGSGRARWIDTGRETLMAAWAPGQDGSDYLAGVNFGEESQTLSTALPGAGARTARVLGKWECVKGKATIVLEPQSTAVLQVSRSGSRAGTAPQVRLLNPNLRSIFLEGEGHVLRAEAESLDGIKEVRFRVRQGGIFAEPRLLVKITQPPYDWRWEFEDTDRGRYAEVWAEAVGDGGGTRESTHALVMVKPW